MDSPSVGGAGGRLMQTAYGFCPECHAPGVVRERRPNGNDVCQAGHQLAPLGLERRARRGLVLGGEHQRRPRRRRGATSARTV